MTFAVYTSLLTYVLLKQLAFAAVPQCVANDDSCHADRGARSGSAMLQTENMVLKPQLFAASEANMKFLDNDVTLLESEFATLMDKTATLESAIGAGGPSAAAAEAVPAVEAAASLASLEAKRTKELKAKVAALEEKSASLKGRVQTLENTIHGGTSSLLAAKNSASADSLESRVKTLQDEASDLKERVTKLEHEVTGSSLVQEEKSKKFLDNDVALLEREMEELGAKVIKLETAVGTSGSASSTMVDTPAVEATSEETPEALLAVNKHAQGADGLLQRVAGLEKTSSDLKGRLETLETSVYGTAALSQIASDLGDAAVDTLSTRVAALKELSAKLQVRATKLESAVTGGGSLLEATWGWSWTEHSQSVSASEGSEGVVLAKAGSQMTNKYMENDVEQIEAEMSTLTKKVEALETTVGKVGTTASSGGGAVDAEVALISIVQEPADSLKPRVDALEKADADLKSRVQTLMYAVHGKASPALFTFSTRQASDNLVSRVESLKKDVDELKAKVTGLDHLVLGGGALFQAGGVPTGKDRSSSKSTTEAETVTMSDSETKYLVNDVEMLEQEMTTLKSKADALETKVGSSTAAIETTSTRISTKRDDLSSRVQVLETDAASMKTRIEKLEGIVSGESATAVDTALIDNTGGDDGLSGRIVELQGVVADLKQRMSSLEHHVTGSSLLHKDNTVPKEQDFSMSDKDASLSTKNKFLVADVDQMITEVDDLKTRTATLESKIGNAGGPASLATKSLLHAKQDPASDLSGKVSKLEEDTTALISQVADLEATVHGSKASLTSLSKEDGLKARIGALQTIVADLSQRVTSLEHHVLGL